MGIKTACLLSASHSTPRTMSPYGSGQISNFCFTPLICPHAATVQTKEEQKLFAWSSQCQHLPGLQFSRKREKSWSSCSGHSGKWTGLDSNLSVLLPILLKKNNSKHAIALCFYRTCHRKSYSFLKISAHTPHLQTNALLYQEKKKKSIM